LICAASAGTIAKRVQEKLGKDVDVFTSPRSGYIWIRATPDHLCGLVRFIDRLDEMYRRDGVLRIVRLTNSDAKVVVLISRSAMPVLAMLGDDRAVHILADVQTNSIIISAPNEKIKQVEGIIHWLDEDRPSDRHGLKG
jgi:type II secretory pathway component GspD/PulD (secretin)